MELNTKKQLQVVHASLIASLNSLRHSDRQISLDQVARILNTHYQREKLLIESAAQRHGYQKGQMIRTLLRCQVDLERMVRKAKLHGQGASKLHMQQMLQQIKNRVNRRDQSILGQFDSVAEESTSTSTSVTE